MMSSTSRTFSLSKTNIPPTAGFTFTTTAYRANFTNTSVDSDGTIAGYAWNFGDNLTSNATNPVHTYASAGTRNVTLKTTDNLGAVGNTSRSVTVSNRPPIASFNYTASNLVVGFSSSPSSDPDGTIVGYAWNFGDSTTSTLANPSHTYGSTGTYTATLTVTDNLGGTGTTTRTFSVTAAPPPNQPPIANLTFIPTYLAVAFTSTSTDPDGTIAGYSWNFGDTATSTVQNPSHTYASPGTRDVVLTVTDNIGATNAVTKAVTVEVQPNIPPVANFTFIVTYRAVTFTSTSTDSDGTITGYAWDFGDSVTSTSQNPSHTYTIPGTYTVTLTVTDNNGATGVVTKEAVAVNQPPVADFTFSSTYLVTNFTSTSSDPDGIISGYAWNFGDGVTSTATNPSHTYAAAGVYNTVLTVTDNNAGTNSVTRAVTVAAQPNVLPVANFTSSVTYLTVNFTSTSTDSDGTISTYLWNFGDGSATTSTQNPSHTYAADGAPSVSLTVTDNSGGQNTVSKQVTVESQKFPPTPNFTFVVNGPKATFTNTSQANSGTLSSYLWTFGDSSTSILRDPVKTYSAVGSYNVQMTVTDSYGAKASIQKVVAITNMAVATATLTGDPSTGAYTVGCNVTPIGTYSVIFSDNGVVKRTENVAPYYLFGDDGTNPYLSKLGVGAHSVSCQVMQNGVQVGLSNTVMFTESTVSSGVSFAMNATGLTSVKYNGIEVLQFGGSYFANSVTLNTGPANMTVTSASLTGTTLKRNFDWGSVSQTYSVTGNKLDLTMVIANTTLDKTIVSFLYVPWEIHLPSPINPDTTPNFGQNVSGPTIQIINSQTEMAIALVNENLTRLLHVGWRATVDTAKQNIPIHISTGRDGQYPTSYPKITDRPIAFGQSDTIKVSWRFGPVGSTDKQLAPDIFTRYPVDVPFILSSWTDRRAIAELFLAVGTNGGTNAGYDDNPRGWELNRNGTDLHVINTDKTLNAAGVAEFHNRLMTYADTSIGIMQTMSAQGMIVWDIEGEFFPQFTTYIGDPTLVNTLAPEMNVILAGTTTPAVDAFFKKFVTAGFKVGVCIRPQHLTTTDNYQTVNGTTQVNNDNDTRAEWAANLVRKINYAKARWGCTLFYCDSNSPSFHDGDIFRSVMAQVPGILITPEYAMHGLLYYGTTAPMYIPGFAGQGGHVAEELGVQVLVPDVLTTYSDAFAVIRPGGVPDSAWPTLTQSTHRNSGKGDILTFSGWWNNPLNTKVKAAYSSALPLFVGLCTPLESNYPAVKALNISRVRNDMPSAAKFVAAKNNGIKILPILAYCEYLLLNGRSTLDIIDFNQNKYAPLAANMGEWARRKLATLKTNLAGEIPEAIEVWNEPEWSWSWKPAQSASDYLKMVIAAATQAWAIWPNVKILVSSNPMYNDNIRPWRSELLSLDTTNILSDPRIHPTTHNYSQVHPPTFRYPNISDDHKYGSFQTRYEDAYNDYFAHGHPDPKVWVTEFGWSTFPRPNTSDPLIDTYPVTVEQQRDYTVQGINIAFASNKVEKMYAFLYRTLEPWNYNWLYPDNTPKLVGDAVKALLT